MPNNEANRIDANAKIAVPISFSEIKSVLKQVNEIGYSTAFVTAFENGVRINLQEAIKKTDKLD